VMSKLKVVDLTFLIFFLIFILFSIFRTRIRVKVMRSRCHTSVTSYDMVTVMVTKS